MRLFTAIVAWCLVWGSLSAASLNDEVAYLLDSHPRLLAARDNIAAADEGVNRAFGEYLPSLDLLDAENEVFNAQISAADAAFDSRIAVYRMLFAIGRMKPASIL